MTAPQLTRITEHDAANEPESEHLFASRPAAPMFPVRSYAISVQSPAGFPITITLNDIKLDQLDNALAALMDRGYMPAEVPSVLTSPNAPAPVAHAQPAAPTGEAPICPVHTDRRMKVSNYGGWFCTAANLQTGEKCKEKIR
jgi:hypothetical protein